MVLLASMSLYLTYIWVKLRWRDAQVPPEHRANGETFDLPQASINDLMSRGWKDELLFLLRYWMVIYKDIGGSLIQVGYVQVYMYCTYIYVYLDIRYR